MPTPKAPRIEETPMAEEANLQRNLPLALPQPSISLPKQTQIDAIAALADLIIQVWKINLPIDHSSEDNIDE
jgi:hypothetical protein